MTLWCLSATKSTLTRWPKVSEHCCHFSRSCCSSCCYCFQLVCLFSCYTNIIIRIITSEWSNMRLPRSASQANLLMAGYPTPVLLPLQLFCHTVLTSKSWSSSFWSRGFFSIRLYFFISCCCINLLQSRRLCVLPMRSWVLHERKTLEAMSSQRNMVWTSSHLWSVYFYSLYLCSRSVVSRNCVVLLIFILFPALTRYCDISSFYSFMSWGSLGFGEKRQEEEESPQMNTQNDRAWNLNESSDHLWCSSYFAVLHVSFLRVVKGSHECHRWWWQTSSVSDTSSSLDEEEIRRIWQERRKTWVNRV